MITPPPTVVPLTDNMAADTMWKKWFTLLYQSIRSTLSYDFEHTATAITISKTLTLVDTTATAVTVTLPSATKHERRAYVIKDVAAGVNAVTISGNIDGAASLVLPTSRGYAAVVSDGIEWHRIG